MQWPPPCPPPAWQILAPAAPASQACAASQAPASADANSEIATKDAEISVLRNRLQQVDRENGRLHGELASAKERAASTDQSNRQKAEVERLQHELQYLKHDLLNSEGERKRLQGSLSSVQTDLDSFKRRQVESIATPQLQSSASLTSATQPLPNCGPQATPAAHAPLLADTPPATASQHVRGSARKGSGEKHWRREALLRELTLWEAASQPVSSSTGTSQRLDGVLPWFALREVVSRLSHAGPGTANTLSSHEKANLVPDDVAAAIATRIRIALEAREWTTVQRGARFTQMWVGLFPETLSEIVARAIEEHVQKGARALGVKLIEVLADALHVVVLDSSKVQESHSGAANCKGDDHERLTCAQQLLETLVEISGKLRSQEFELLKTVFRRPSLCALLALPPCTGSLHCPTMRFLQVALQSTDLFALVHQSDSHENVLLAVANLLIVPTIISDRRALKAETGILDNSQDSPERQKCRIGALEFFCRCLATAPRMDIVLQLRGAPAVDGEPVDTVLQRVALLCHHELVCLGLHGTQEGPLHDAELQQCVGRRQRIIELSLSILSSFVWHAAPWTAELQAENNRLACMEASVALGRTGPLLASIVDMIVRRAPQSPAMSQQLSSASALRVLLPHTEGNNGTASKTGSTGESHIPSMVVDD